MSSNSKAIAKHKKKYNKWPAKRRLRDFKSSILNYLPAFIVVLILKKFLIKSDYRLKRESFSYFQRANAAYGMHKQRRSTRLASVAFELLGKEFPKSYSWLIVGATNQTQKDASRRSALSSEILAATSKLEIGITNATGWYQLSRGLFSVGYFRAAWVARENSIVLSIREGETPGAGATAVSRAIQAHLESRNFAKVEVLLAKVAEQIKDSELRDVYDYLNMMQNKYVLHPLEPNSPSATAEGLFRALISNKTIVLVGPGSPSGKHGNEIDSADTVVRVKFVGREHLPPQEFHGHRCEINYFGNSEIQSLLANYSKYELNDWYQNLRLTLSSNSTDSGIGHSTILNLSESIPTYRTPPYSGLRLIFAICREEPLRLKLFGLNFYADTLTYSLESQKYLVDSANKLGHNLFDQRGIAEQKSFYRARDLFVHDAISNFCLAQNLYKAGLFDIEPYGKSILELTPYQYVERLEEMLGDW